MSLVFPSKPTARVCQGEDPVGVSDADHRAVEMQNAARVQPSTPDGHNYKSFDQPPATIPGGRCPTFWRVISVRKLYQNRFLTAAALQNPKKAGLKSEYEEIHILAFAYKAGASVFDLGLYPGSDIERCRE